MFGCCKFAMQHVYCVDYGDKPDLEVLKSEYGDEISLEQRPNLRNPQDIPLKWVMVSPGKEEDVCTCGCHVRNGPAIMC
jgi:hypothetical protein